MPLSPMLHSLFDLPILEYRGGHPLPPSAPTDVDAILVLGHQLEPDGSMRPRLVARLEAALALANLNPRAPLVLSGGRLDAPRSEAEAMAEWLSASGIPANRLHLEDQSLDTLENAVYSLDFLRQLGAERIALVSTGYHIRRGLMLLQTLAERRGEAMIFLHLASIDPDRGVDLSSASPEERDAMLTDFARAIEIDLGRSHGA